MLLFICGYNYIILRLAKFLLYYNSICKIFEMKDGGCILHECKKVTIATPVIVLILNLKNIETLSRVFFSRNVFIGERLFKCFAVVSFSLC